MKRSFSVNTVGGELLIVTICFSTATPEPINLFGSSIIYARQNSPFKSLPVSEFQHIHRVPRPSPLMAFGTLDPPRKPSCPSSQSPSLLCGPPQVHHCVPQGVHSPNVLCHWRSQNDSPKYGVFRHAEKLDLKTKRL